VIPTGRDIYFTQGSRARLFVRIHRILVELSHSSKLELRNPVGTRRDPDRAFVLELRGGLPIGQEALQPSELCHSPNKATPSYYTKNEIFASEISM
jgi:hypothetical protein